MEVLGLLVPDLLFSEDLATGTIDSFFRTLFLVVFLLTGYTDYSIRAA